MVETQPHAPDSLPKYLADGLPKQNVETLQDIREFVDDLIEHKQRPVDHKELPGSVEPIEDDSDDNDEKGGTIVKEKVKCGDETCHCAEGELHGPYLYRYRRDSSGKVVSEYVGKPN